MSRDPQFPTNTPNKSLSIAALSRIAHFSDLPAPILEEIVAHASACHFDAGQIIYMEGDPAERLFILEQGWIKAVRLSSEGREQAMMFMRSGEVFGDVAVLTDAPYPCTVVALEPVESWAIEKGFIKAMIARHPELAAAVIQRLGERVLHYVNLVEDLGLRTVEARLANTLLKHAEKTGETWAVPRRRWTTFDEMAVRLGTVRDVLGRALRTLEAEGLLRVEHNQIIIIDMNGLEARGRV